MAGLLCFQVRPAQWMLPRFQTNVSERWFSFQALNRRRKVSRNLSLSNANLGVPCQLNAAEASTISLLANDNQENEVKMVLSNPTGEGVSADKPHVPVLLSEVLSFFKDNSLRVFLDGTVGAGGHSAAILEEHFEMQHYIGLDVDPLAHNLTRQRLQAVLEDRREHSNNVITGSKTELHLVQSNFDRASEILTNMGLFPRQVDGMLLDIGVSSMQVDEAERGFSFMQDGPIDMRMNPTGPLSASDIVNSWGEAEIGRILRDYGEERRWRHIARRIVEARLEGQIESTRQLVGIIGGGKFKPRQAGKKGRPGLGLHPATRTFQALRIAANDELGALSRAIPKAIESLARGGRLAIISFHSLEDRIVKRAFLEAAKGPLGEPRYEEEKSVSHIHVPGKTRYSKYRSKREVREGILGGGEGNVGLEGEAEEEDEEIDEDEDTNGDMGGTEGEIRILTKRPIVATEEEMKTNPRSRSAKLRVLEKL